MNEVVQEWLEHGLADLGTAQREAAVVESTNWFAVCFHAQQAVEKLFKGALAASKVVAPRTHDLVLLSEMLTAASADWHADTLVLSDLTRGAVQFRYPGEHPTAEEARIMVAAAEEVCARLRQFIAELPEA